MLLLLGLLAFCTVFAAATPCGAVQGHVPEEVRPAEPAPLLSPPANPPPPQALPVPPPAPRRAQAAAEPAEQQDDDASGKRWYEPLPDQPTDVVFKAIFPDKAFNEEAFTTGNLKGTVLVEAASDGVGAQFVLKLSNLPWKQADWKPFLYDIQQLPVPEDGNCDKTGGPFNPARLRNRDCDQRRPERCGLGALSTKYGRISRVSDRGEWQAAFVDRYTSLQAGNDTYVGDKSVVVRFGGGSNAIISCANFQVFRKE